jgi:hypothetical protein
MVETNAITYLLLITERCFSSAWKSFYSQVSMFLQKRIMEIFSILWKVNDKININSTAVFTRKEIALKFPKSYNVIRFKG